MNEKLVAILPTVAVIMLVFVLGLVTLDVQYQTKVVIAQDLNVLKGNDVAFAQYIQANSTAITTLHELSQQCKILEDGNYSTTYQCIVPKK